MGIDRKYGQVTTQYGTIGEFEPVVVFRAQDRLLPGLLEAYRQMCADAGSPDHHLQLITDTAYSVAAWQADNATKVPASDMLAP